MKIAYLLVLFVLNGVFLRGQQKPKEIIVNVKKYNSLNLSEIAEEVVMVTLESPPNLSLYKISKVLLVDKFIYVLSGSIENKGFPEHVLQFDLKGGFIKELDRRNKETGVLMKITKLFFSESKIYVKYEQKVKRYAVFNSKGVLQYSKKYLDSFMSVFNNSLWNENVSFDFDKGVALHSVEKRNITSNKVEIALEFKEDLRPRAIKNKIESSILSNYSVSGNKLFIAPYFKNVGYIINNNAIATYEFRLTNNLPGIMPIKPNSCMLNNYVKFGYMSGRNPFVYLYNIVNNKGYNIKISRDENGQEISGIQDDILNTGFVGLMNTNKKEIAYFTKRKYELPEIFNESDSSDSVVFLVKIK